MVFIPPLPPTTLSNPFLLISLTFLRHSEIDKSGKGTSHSSLFRFVLVFVFVVIVVVSFFSSALFFTRPSLYSLLYRGF